MRVHERSRGRRIGATNGVGGRSESHRTSPPDARLYAALTYAALLGVVWGVACASGATGLPQGSQRFTPPAQYHAWWALTESCSGLQGDFNKVAWYRTPNTNSFSIEGTSFNGAWDSEGNRIVLGDSGVAEGPLVRHEMLHALMQSGTHPRQQFLGNCSDIVACIEKCMSDAGGPPDTSDAAAIIGPASLPAAIRVEPDTVSLSADSGWFTVTLSITNTTSQPAREQVFTFQSLPETVVVFFAKPAAAWNGSSEYQMDYYFTLAPADSATSTRRVVFDAQAVTAPTQLTVSGTFGESNAAPQTLTVTP